MYSNILFCLLCHDQGEAPAFVVDDFKSNFSNGFHLKPKGCETAVNVGCNRTV